MTRLPNPLRLLIPLAISILVQLAAIPSVRADVITHHGFDYLDIKHGLSDNTVPGIGQDDLGFMWFGTLKGLDRYDGYEIKTYNPPADSPITSPLRISALLVARDNRIWMFDSGTGVVVFDPSVEEFTGLGFLGADTTSADNWSLLDWSEGPDGAIWISTDGEGVARIAPPTGGQSPSWVWFQDFPMSSHPLDCVSPTAEGTVLLGSRKGEVTELDARGSVVRTFGLPVWQGYRRPKITDIFETGDGIIWFCTNVGLYRHVPGSGDFELLQPRPSTKLSTFNGMTSVTGDSAGDLWIGSYEGLYRFDPTTRLFELYPHDPNDPGSPIRGPVTKTFCGTSGVVWASCWFSGIIKYDPSAVSFRIEGYNPLDPHGLAERSVHALYEDPDGSLWVGTGFRGPGNSEGVLHKRAPGSSKFDRWRFPDNRVTSIEVIFRDDDGQIWIGTNSGLWRFVEGSAEPLVRAEGEPGTRGLMVFALAADEAGDLWIGSRGKGVYVRDRSSGDLRNYMNDPDDDRSLSEDFIGSIKVDSGGGVWVGTDGGGLVRYDESTDSFQRFLQAEGDTKNVSSMITRPDGGLWIGTYAGLIDFHPDSGVRRKFDQSSGLPNETVTQVQMDDSGCCWFSLGTGIGRLDPGNGRIRVFSDDDGLGDFGGCFAAIRRQSGTLLFGGAGGILEFDPDQFVTNDYHPPVVFSDVTINSEAILAPAIDKLELAHDQNDIGFTFAALDYTAVSGILYRHRLDGFDQQWSDPGTDRTIKYTNLDPGSYRLRVLVSNSQGQWNTDEALFPFFIRKPWWTTWPAWAGYFILVVLLLLLAQRQQVARERIRRNLALNSARARHLSEMSETKSKFLVNAAHEFRGPLTLIKSLIPQGGDPEANLNKRSRAMMERNVARLENLTDQLSALASLETGGVEINRRMGSSVELLRELAMMYRAVARKRGVQFIFHGPDDKGEGWVDFDLLEKVFVHLLESAIKSTAYRGSIDVGISVDRNAMENGFRLTIEVTHSGSGYSPEELERVFDRFYSWTVDEHQPASGSGIGLTLVKEFTLLLGGEVSAESIGKDSIRFRVELPIPSSNGAEHESIETEMSEDLNGNGAPRTNGSLRGADHMLMGRLPGGGDPQSDQTRDDLNTILIIDGDADIRSFLRAKLGAEFNILEAIDGSAGLEIATTDLPDLILCDERIGNLSGIGLCGQIKQKWRTQGIQVIIFFSDNDEKTRVAAYGAGADDCIFKPYNFNEVRVRVDNVIEQRSRVLGRHGNQPEEAAGPRPVDLLATEDDFMTSLNLFIDQNLDKVEFGVEELAGLLYMSRRTLHRKLLDLSGQTCSNYLRNRRLQRAAQLLSNGYNNVTEVSLAVGYKNPSNFSRAFRELFGASPSQYRKTGL